MAVDVVDWTHRDVAEIVQCRGRRGGLRVAHHGARQHLRRARLLLGGRLARYATVCSHRAAPVTTYWATWGQVQATRL